MEAGCAEKVKVLIYYFPPASSAPQCHSEKHEKNPLNQSKSHPRAVMVKKSLAAGATEAGGAEKVKVLIYYFPTASSAPSVPQREAS